MGQRKKTCHWLIVKIFQVFYMPQMNLKMTFQGCNCHKKLWQSPDQTFQSHRIITKIAKWILQKYSTAIKSNSTIIMAFSKYFNYNKLRQKL